jgi:hypothetical protein
MSAAERLSNPKSIAFFTAFLPQFVDPARPAALRLVVMCVATVMLAGVSDSCWVVAPGLGQAWFMRPGRTKVGEGLHRDAWADGFLSGDTGVTSPHQQPSKTERYSLPHCRSEPALLTNQRNSHGDIEERG